MHIYERKIEYLNNKRIIYRRLPITDKPTDVYEWGNFYQHGTYEYYEMFRSKAKINTYKGLLWHLIVIWYLNPNMLQDDLKSISKFISVRANGFVTFEIYESNLERIIYEVSMYDLEKPPPNKLRKIIFKEFCGLDIKQKLSIVGQMIGRGRTINEDDIYDAMIMLHENDEKITINGLSKYLKCSARTVQRNIGNELKKEKQLLNKQL
jgi:hypothetical protein